MKKKNFQAALAFVAVLLCAACAVVSVYVVLFMLSRMIGWRAFFVVSCMLTGAVLAFVHMCQTIVDRYADFV